VNATAARSSPISAAKIAVGGDSLLAFFEYPKGINKVDRDAIGAMQHVSPEMSWHLPDF
jgi:hypothetical protein